MNSSSQHPTSDQAVSDKFSSLLEMGFKRVDPQPITVESVRVDADSHKVTQVQPAMGSFVTISALHQSETMAEAAIGEAFEKMDRVIAVLNRFDGNSALAYLNDTGRIDSAPPELIEVISGGLDYHQLTSGAFDITVKPIIDLFRDPKTYEPRMPPSNAELSEARELVGTEHIGFDDEAVGGSGQTILDAIAACRQLLLPGGKLAFTVPLGYNPDLDRLLEEDGLGQDRGWFLLRRGTRDWHEVDRGKALGTAYGRPYSFANALFIAEFDAPK